MFDGYNNIREIVFAFSKGRMTYANLAAEYYFNSYVYVLNGGEISLFFEEESVEGLIAKLKTGENFREKLKLCGGKELEFSVKHIKDEYERDTVIFVQESDKKDIAENILKASSVKSLYDPLMMGKGDLYRCELMKLSDDALYILDKLQCSALIQRNPSVFDDVKMLEDKVKELSSRAVKMIDELTSAESKYVITKSVFDLNEMLETIDRRVNNYINLEDLNIDFIYTSRQGEFKILGNYNTLAKAITGLIYNAVTYVRASGRRGRISLSLTHRNEDAVIEITDNGIGLSEATFSYINEGETDISSLSDTDKKEFLNLQLINSYIEMHNGMLMLDNTKEKGSRATVVLPLISKTYAIMRQGTDLYGIEDDIDKILGNGLIYLS